MDVVGIDTVRVPSFPNLIFVVVHTAEGISGLGETFYGSEAVEAHIHSIVARELLGQDALRIEHHAAALAGYTGYQGTGVETRARSAVDVALWDILGKATGQPVMNLLGGATRADIAIYNTCAGRRYVNSVQGQAVANWGVAPGQYEDLYAAIHHPGELARELLDQGIRAMKIWPFDPFAEASGGSFISRRDLSEALGRVAAIREATGDEMDIMVELHGLWDVPTAQQIVRALEDFDPLWVEDPVRSDIVGGLARVARETSVRIAAGETVGGAGAFVELLRAEAVDVVTVDTTWSGGLTTARKVAAIADAFGVPIAPHDCTGPVSLTVCTHLAMAASNAFIQETVRAGYLGWYAELVEGGPVIAGGRIRPNGQPGLGIQLRPDLAQQEGVVVRSTRASANSLISS